MLACSILSVLILSMYFGSNMLAIAGEQSAVSKRY